MGMQAILCTLSSKRLDLLQDDPEILDELLESRHESEIPGLLDLGKAWDALDVLIADRGKEPVLGDVILARKGQKLRAQGPYGPPRVLTPARVRQIAAALAKLPPDFIRTRYPSLQGQEVHGRYGQAVSAPDASKSVREKAQAQQERELAELEGLFRDVTALYGRAAIEGHSMMSVIV